MYIMPSCFSSSKTTKETTTSTNLDNSIDERSVDNFIMDNPLIFRICCCCVARRRKRIGTAKQNGAVNLISDNISTETVLQIEQIEFIQTSPIANGT